MQVLSTAHFRNCWINPTVPQPVATAPWFAYMLVVVVGRQMDRTEALKVRAAAAKMEQLEHATIRH